MKKVGSLIEVEEGLLKEIKGLLSKAKECAPTEVTSVRDGLVILWNLRDSIYEALNQIQHAGLLLEAAKWLNSTVLDGRDADWYWNPHQTGGRDEPDLRCDFDAKRIVAEATASKSPEGTIDVRMASTLKKLSGMEGARYFFVKTESMKQRAETKIKKGGWEITVVQLAGGDPIENAVAQPDTV